MLSRNFCLSVRENFRNFYSVLRCAAQHSVQNWKIYSHQKIFRQINYLNSLAKLLVSRNFYSCGVWMENTKIQHYLNYFSWNQYTLRFCMFFVNFLISLLSQKFYCKKIIVKFREMYIFDYYFSGSFSGRISWLSFCGLCWKRWHSLWSGWPKTWTSQLWKNDQRNFSKGNIYIS